MKCRHHLNPKKLNPMMNKNKGKQFNTNISTLSKANGTEPNHMRDDLAAHINIKNIKCNLPSLNINVNPIILTLLFFYKKSVLLFVFLVFFYFVWKPFWSFFLFCLETLLVFFLFCLETLLVFFLFCLEPALFFCLYVYGPYGFIIPVACT